MAIQKSVFAMDLSWANKKTSNHATAVVPTVSQRAKSIHGMRAEWNPVLGTPRASLYLLNIHIINVYIISAVTKLLIF